VLLICEQILSLDINSSPVHPLLLTAYQGLNRLPELIQIYQNFLKEYPFNPEFQKGYCQARHVMDERHGSS